MKPTTHHPITIIQCNVANTPAVMERLLRVVRVRGFAIESIDMKTNHQCLEIELGLYGERSVSMLINQLNKLIEVKRVYHSTQTTAERMTA